MAMAIARGSGTGIWEMLEPEFAEAPAPDRGGSCVGMCMYPWLAELKFTVELSNRRTVELSIAPSSSLLSA